MTVLNPVQARANDLPRIKAATCGKMALSGAIDTAILARGTVSVEIQLHDKPGRHKRVASIGPGLTFGEMALLDGGTRSADVIANEKVICYGLGVEELHELAKEHPNVMITILGNLTREFSERLRHANEEISVLE